MSRIGEEPPIYEAIKRDYINCYNLWTAHRVSTAQHSLLSVSQGEPAFQNSWAIFTNSYSEPVLHHITDKNTWQAVKSTNESNEAIEINEIFAGEDYELWGIQKRTNTIFRRVLRKLEEYYPDTVVWEKIFTPENNIRAISACNILNVWLLLDSPYANRSRVCKLTLSPPNWAQKPIEGFFNEKKYFDFSWNYINVDKTLQTFSVNYRGELWAADSAGKLYQRISSSLEAFSSVSSNQMGSSSLYRSKSDNLQSPSLDFQSDFDDFKDSSASSINSSKFGESEVIQSLDENLDEALWREVDVSGGANDNTNDPSIKIVSVSVGSKTVWCVDDLSRIYVRNGAPIFRKVVSPQEGAVLTASALKQSQLIVSKAQPPVILSPNRLEHSVFRTDRQLPESLTILRVGQLSVGRDDVVSAVSKDREFLFRFKPQVLSLITTGGYAKIWDNRGNSNATDFGIWRPIPPTGFFPLAHFCERSLLLYPLTHNFESPNSKVINAMEDERQYKDLHPIDEGFDLIPRILIPSADLIKIWDSKDAGIKVASGDLALYMPNCNKDYVYLSLVAGAGSEVPKTNSVMCIHQSAALRGRLFRSPGVRGAHAAESVWKFEGRAPLTVYEVCTLNGGVSAGGFVATTREIPNLENVWVLNVSDSSWIV